MPDVINTFLPQNRGHSMQFQHSSERDELQTAISVRFQVADHDTITLQSHNIHNTGKYDLVWAPVFQFVQAFQILYRNYGKHLRNNFCEL